MRDRAFELARQGAGICRDGVLWSLRRLWHSFIFLITREKVIQAGITSILFGIIMALTESYGIYASEAIYALTGWFVPSKMAMVPPLVLLLGAFLWADNNIEAWRDLVADASGEEEAVEKAEQADEEESDS